MVGWARTTRGIHLEYIKPGSKPTQMAYIERFTILSYPSWAPRQGNRTYREDVLDAYLFNSIEEAREFTEKWMEEYPVPRRCNAVRPHEALGGVPPYQFQPSQP
jgi:putative transposase